MTPPPARRVTLAAFMFLASCRTGASADAKAIADACTESTNLPQSTCECLGDRAESDLSGDERSFVLAALRQDTSETARLRGRLGLEGAMKAGMFMTNAATCAREAADEEDAT